MQASSKSIAPASAAWLLVAATALAACQPRVALEAPKEPITINLNIKLDADVRLRIERQAEEDIQENPDIF
ncbi:YnbE family lipoprotein [Algihabitans albus]|uniref:YnbE family lipoprotein n=1 Tax=Algihabitans albus TaxID=2164067 RepID=UPI001F1B8153|nr:YnbE family lipoprotein [Algihabitans albus]